MSISSIFLATTLTASSPVFVMTEPHCEMLSKHANMAMTMKGNGETYQDFVRGLMEGYRYSSGESVLIMDHILPYSLEVGYEYFHSPFDPNTPSSRVVYERCMDNLGAPSK